MIFLMDVTYFIYQVVKHLVLFYRLMDYPCVTVNYWPPVLMTAAFDSGRYTTENRLYSFKSRNR